MSTVVVRRFDVPLSGWPPDAKPLRIAHISDLHLRCWNKLTEKTQRLLVGLEYDLLAVTGDFCVDPDKSAKPAEVARRLFQPVHPKLGTFAVLGNHDHPKFAAWSNINLTFLSDECRTLRHRGTRFVIAGVQQSVENCGDSSAALSQAPAGMPTILLAHYPSTVYELLQGRVGLMLAGHTHGGQIRFPLLGCVWAHDGIPTRLARGLHAVDSTQLHVSAGLGTSGPLPIRVLCPPEITLLTLRGVPSRQYASIPGPQQHKPIGRRRERETVPV